MWRWLLLPFFILQAAWELFTTPMTEEQMVVAQLSPKNRARWKTLTPEEKDRFRKALAEDKRWDDTIKANNSPYVRLAERLKPDLHDIAKFSGK